MRLIRKPSFNKSFSARTRGQITRSIKREIIPGYGEKGMGWAHPRRKLYNEVYSHSTIGVNPMSSRTSRRKYISKQKNSSGCGCLICLFIIIFLLMIVYL